MSISSSLDFTEQTKILYISGYICIQLEMHTCIKIILELTLKTHDLM